MRCIPNAQVEGLNPTFGTKYKQAPNLQGNPCLSGAFLYEGVIGHEEGSILGDQ